ncbi:fumarylacetoacetate hydrolase family protein [Pandoraea fibrosis]|uniref:Fumarylacetoacetate hydrolase family protein n=1 Tax=Pandoraea fibrosis TaxID=1891094 RepID=A0ABX6HQN8_9BURK|nr:fumarylacetoacetate hydrolase family protein [Pandoraea fibrosis]QHE93225.1 fumarylacetoacetate hydrolase family protein [Pandoraea fibrosis]QHF13216.1 fumarylacetoacetate hydrolase family protein [Pandoraea fibrosis]
MKLATFTRPGKTPVIGIVLPDLQQVIDLQAAHVATRGEPLPAFIDMLALMRAGDVALDRAADIQQAVSGDEPFVHPFSTIRFLAPVPVPEQIRDFSTFDLHMQQAGAAMAKLRAHRKGEFGTPLPRAQDIALPSVYFDQPIYYKANRFNVVGADHVVRWPRKTVRLDYEAEFGVFIGKSGRDISARQARDHIFGFTIFNDFSARDLQEHEMEAPFGPAKGKDFDTGNAMGPWIVTADEIPDPYDLSIAVRVNGQEWSRGSTRDMRHSFEIMIEHVSRDETLHVGEFLGSGTVGNGCGLELDRWIQSGDDIEIEVEKIGVLRNRVLHPTD